MHEKLKNISLLLLDVDGGKPRMLAFIVPRFETVFADLMGGRPMPAFTPTTSGVRKYTG